jgi:hypothetical protein
MAVQEPGGAATGRVKIDADSRNLRIFRWTFIKN